MKMLFKALALFASLAVCCTAASQDYPTKPIRLVVGFPAGGQSDIIGRLVAESLSQQLHQAVIVENKGGASGIIAADYVARQPGDGYTILLTSESLQSRAAAVFKRLPYDPINDFRPIGKFAKQKVLMVVNSSSKFKSVKEFLAYARENPAKLNYGATYSTSSQFGAALFNQLNKIEMVGIYYPGGAKPMTDLLGNVVDVGFFVESTVSSFVQAGSMRALAVASNERSSLFPSVPTLREAGAAPMEVSPWFGLVVPAKTPDKIVSALSDALSKAVDSPVMRGRMNVIGASAIRGSTPEKFGTELREEVTYWKKFVADTKFPLLD